ncbi:hypothetical protein PoB_001169100 [Plakobranchus ocellatus]|uniref:Uncharacterized protein n=1 Tax=Plakobranchus ocellatus TaxID=259542 RepID=A0AAV3YPI0_9GAST|nr:hypothetical protein PoB_001169100 [Plakobranchus ocellatus]
MSSFLIFSLYCLYGSGGSSGRAVGYHPRGPGFDSQSRLSQIFIAPLYPPSTKWVARSLKSESKGGEESNGKLLQMPYAKNNQDPTPGSPMLRLSLPTPSSLLLALSSLFTSFFSQLPTSSSLFLVLSFRLLDLYSNLSASDSQISAPSSQLPTASSLFPAFSSRIQALYSDLSVPDSQLSTPSSQLLNSSPSFLLPVFSSRIPALSSQPQAL